MYERFEFDLRNASFDWDDDKDRINLQNTAFISERQ